MGLIDLKHWFLLTNMELSTMDMELFRFNHARFVSPYPVDKNFLIENRNTFNFSQFQVSFSANFEFSIIGGVSGTYCLQMECKKPAFEEFKNDRGDFYFRRYLRPGECLFRPGSWTTNGRRPTDNVQEAHETG